MIKLYLITNLINKKRYVGQTIKKNFMHRWSQHKNKPRNKAEILSPLKRSILKHGANNFKVELVATVSTQDIANLFERVLIKKYDTLVPNGYNRDLGGNNVGKHSKETGLKISKKLTGRKTPKDVIEKIRAGSLKNTDPKRWSEINKEKSRKTKGIPIWSDDKRLSFKKRMSSINGKTRSKIIMDQFGNYYASITDAAISIGGRRENVRHVLKGRDRSCCGYKFEYVTHVPNSVNLIRVLK